jgi:hypothetical protein
MREIDSSSAEAVNHGLHDHTQRSTRTCGRCPTGSRRRRKEAPERQRKSQGLYVQTHPGHPAQPLHTETQTETLRDKTTTRHRTVPGFRLVKGRKRRDSNPRYLSVRSLSRSAKRRTRAAGVCVTAGRS